ncbi:MAG TPA: DUF3288 domain-containing protein [Cyanobacteria bacterium UBA9273]|nr:DUF3288 domain-containing protein [Cyanobacteria bacterium UBA9273]
MASEVENKDQQHPQEKRDRVIVERLLQEPANEYNQVELARMRIRYTGFPGAREIQYHLDAVLQRWQMTEEELFDVTRQIHAVGQVYKRDSNSEGQEDWT